MIETLEQTNKYTSLNIAFKVLVFVFILLFIIFYFELNLFSLKLFKGRHYQDQKYIPPPQNTNRQISNAIINTNSQGKFIQNFFIKTAFNCCNVGFASADSQRIKTILSQGFRCLDFNLIYKNNTLVIKDQINKETFYNALETINNFAFSNSICNNNDDPLIINIRLEQTDITTRSKAKLVYKKLREMFRVLNSSNFLSEKYSLMSKYISQNSAKYADVLQTPIEELSGKIIIMCNYDYEIVDELDATHDLLQYIHLNTSDVENNPDDSVNINIVSINAHQALMNNDENALLSINMTQPNMIIPVYNTHFMLVENPSSLYDAFGYTFRALDFSSILDFEQDITDNDDIKVYIDEFNLMGSAFILKPVRFR